MVEVTLKTSQTSIDPFEKVLQRLAQEIVLAKTYLKWAIAIPNADPVVLNTAPMFFSLSVHGYLVLTQLHIARLYDKSENTMTIFSLLSSAKSHREAFCNKDELDRFIAETESTTLPELKDTLESIRKIRNKVFAHNDPKTLQNLEEFEKDLRLTKPDLEKALITAGNILNGISVFYNDVTNYLELWQGDDYENALDLIADAKCAEVEEFEKRFGIKADFERPAKCSKHGIHNR